MLFGLYFEEEPGEERVRYTSFTDPLDQWVSYEQGIRTKPAPKPQMKIPARSAAILDSPARGATD